MTITTRPLRSRNALAAALLLAAALALSACAPSPDSPASPSSSAGSSSSESSGTNTSAYTAQFEQARQLATSDFEREVLADDKITRAEYEEAWQRFSSCLEAQGININLVDQGGFYIFGIPVDASDAFDQVEAGCAEGTTAIINPLYIELLRNPANENEDELIVACLIESGLADPSFTVEQWEELRQGGSRVDGGNVVQGSADWPFDNEDPRYGACLRNPSDPQPVG